MSLEDFDPAKHGVVAAFFAAALAFLMYLLGKAKALFKNGDADQIKSMLTKLDEKVDGIDVRLARIEGAQGWDGETERRSAREHPQDRQWRR